MEGRAMKAVESEPDWLVHWEQSGLRQAEALERFDAAPPASITDMIGLWSGESLCTDHPLDHALESFGWYGKAFRRKDDVDPLLFRSSRGKIIALDPGRMPIKLATRFPNLLTTATATLAFKIVHPFFVTERPAARLRLVSYRETSSAAMIYDGQPIIDHFRKIAQDRLLGLMDMRSMSEPYFFLLTKVDAVLAARLR